jgi:hypothetical protein
MNQNTMTSGEDLRSGVIRRLRGDGRLLERLHTHHDRIDAEECGKRPCVVVREVETREDGSQDEHRMTVDVLARDGGLAEALNIAAQIAQTLDRCSTLELDRHNVLNVRWLATDARRARNGTDRMASLRFRAITESSHV